MTTPLITRLEEAAEGSPELAAEVEKALGVVLTGIGNDGVWGVKEGRYAQSLNAALALADRVLPSASFRINYTPHSRRWRTIVEIEGEHTRATTTGSTPALAVCAAILDLIQSERAG